jgi:hypothetical protein
MGGVGSGGSICIRAQRFTNLVIQTEHTKKKPTMYRYSEGNMEFLTLYLFLKHIFKFN